MFHGTIHRALPVRSPDVAQQNLNIKGCKYHIYTINYILKNQAHNLIYLLYYTCLGVTDEYFQSEMPSSADGILIGTNRLFFLCTITFFKPTTCLTVPISKSVGPSN